MITRLVLALCLGLTGTAALAADAGSPKAINTGGEKGAYNSLFCPPIPGVLAEAYFQGYACTPSKGTLDNIARVLATPSQIGFAQLDVFAREQMARPEEFKKLALIRRDIACEGLWMVTRNERLTGYGDVLGFARRIPFVLPPEGSGAAASFAFLQAADPEGLGKVPKANIKNVADATAVINEVANSSAGAVGFFVQFADPENANIKLINDKKLTIIPVASREILRMRIGDEPVYQVQSFALKSAGLISKGKEVATACTPVAIFTGAPDALPEGNARVDHKDMIEKVKTIPAEKLLPQETRIAALIKGARKLTDQAVEQINIGVEKAKQSIDKQLGN
ncbi:MAG: hypothetical protein SH859_16930 [Hyphomicrobium aestuarii]|nr:hypothetical protein [Hyphomicrobium aestuarii]